MPAPSPMVVTLFTLVAGLACLFVSVTLIMFTFRQWKLTRNDLEQRLRILAERFHDVESRVGELEVRLRPLHHGARTPVPPPPGHTRTVGKSQLSVESTKVQDFPAEPPLIAVPNLGAADGGGAEVESDDELGARHGEAWRLAAAGALPSEIARQTGQPIGQVELIVGLYHKLHSSRGPADHARSH